MTKARHGAESKVLLFAASPLLMMSALYSRRSADKNMYGMAIRQSPGKGA